MTAFRQIADKDSQITFDPRGGDTSPAARSHASSSAKERGVS
jgi:hypothetical protein